MDRIKKALDKSRTSRRPKLVGNAADAPTDDMEHRFEKIEYSQTRTIEMPQQRLAENRLIAGNRSDPRANVFRVLRTQVLHAMRENNWNSLAVTGPTSGIGKTLIAANLAISISLDVNQTVLLVDVDLRRPSIHKIFGIFPDRGLIDYLNGEAKIEELFLNPGFKRLVLLPGRESATGSSELLSSPRMLNLVKDIKKRYESRIIIFDMPPLLNTDDAIVFLPSADASIMVVENGNNTQSEVQNSLRLLEGSNLIGTVLNKADEEVRDYY